MATKLVRSGAASPPISGARRGWGGIVPHASWICSGALAGQTLGALHRLNIEAPAVVVVFGAVHTPIDLDRAALDVYAAWSVPGGQTRSAVDLSQGLASASRLFVADERFHRREHAVEVEVPLIQAVWPSAEILAIETPLVEDAIAIGRETAQRVLSTWRSAVFLASSDFTHYGPNYSFIPAGVGLPGLQWAKNNDERLLKLTADFAAERIVGEVREHHNACGGGAIAAMLAACREAGATGVSVLRHASSYQTLAGLVPDDPTNAVGYASVVVT